MFCQQPDMRFSDHLVVIAWHFVRLDGAGNNPAPAKIRIRQIVFIGIAGVASQRSDDRHTAMKASWNIRLKRTFVESINLSNPVFGPYIDVGLLVLLISLCRQFLRTPREEASPHAWRTKMMAAEFLYGLSWAAVAFVSGGSAGEAAHTFVFAALLIVISMRMLFATPVMPIVYAGTLPMAAAIVVRFALLDNPYYWAMAAMAVGVEEEDTFLVEQSDEFRSIVVEMERS